MVWIIVGFGFAGLTWDCFGVCGFGGFVLCLGIVVAFVVAMVLAGFGGVVWVDIV